MTMELIVLKVPEKTLVVKTDEIEGLQVRPDKTELLDLNINTGTLRDRKSNVVYRTGRIC